MVAPRALRDHRHIGTPITDPRARRRHPRLSGLTRSSTDRMVAGVCGGIARWIGVDAFIVRIAFVVLGISGGFGILVYLVFWALVPDDKGARGIDAVGRGGARDRSQRALAVLLLVVGGLLMLREMGLWIGDRFVWPVVLAALGLALAWPEVGTDAFRLGGRSREGLLGSRAALVRIGLGIGAVAAGATMFAVANADLHDMADVAMAVALAVAGVLLIFGPWWVRLGRDLVEERRRRIRSEERAEVAARVHDSVLQTLALIQRRAGDPVETARLARRQERELRGWLFGEPASANGATLRAATAEAAAEVEDLYGVAVEVVAVGDLPTDDRTEALVAAAREAMVNAAKFAGVPAVDVYLEVDDGAASLFVRDRGSGFDPGEVAPDRKGIAESIRRRMERLGGRAHVRSAPGEGTEVELSLPRGTP